jgi:hypothetical protein
VSVTPQNSERARSLLDKDAGVVLQNRQGARALSSLDLGRWAESGPVLLSHFPFSFTAEL